MYTTGVTFSVLEHAAWAPGLATPEAWAEWAAAPFPIAAEGEPEVRAMPAMLRRRAGQLGKMALETAYQCLGERSGVPTVFCSRHGDVGRAVKLLDDLARGEALSPTGFGMAVHNASAGLFSIARADRANHIALAAGAASLHHALIEACGLLADGADTVLLVMCDCPLPAVFSHFEDCQEQPHAFAWLLAAADLAAPATMTLNWRPCREDPAPAPAAAPASLDALRFYLSGAAVFEQVTERRRWHWTRHA